ncbi:MAG: hypothetical protein M1826_005901 [Phylliscum demangeonii]|nr:MAG: hypothetical protein M1826_005901 [Phylliscum demangeonii]
MAPTALVHLSLLFLLLGLVAPESYVAPDNDPPTCPARPRLGPGVAPVQLDADDNLEAILVVASNARLACRASSCSSSSTGAVDHSRASSGRWQVSEVLGDDDGNVHDYGQVLRAATRPYFGLAKPSFLGPQPARRILLPSMGDMLSQSADQLGPLVGSYEVKVDHANNHLHHVFTTAAVSASGKRHDYFRGSSLPPAPAPATAPTSSYPEPDASANALFIAPLPAEARNKDGAVRAYRLWDNVSLLVSRTCVAGQEPDRVVSYRALFFLYGHGNALRDNHHARDLPPVCYESRNRVVTDDSGRRGGRGSKRAFLAQGRRQKARQPSWL